MTQTDLYKAMFHRKSTRKYDMTPLNSKLMDEIKGYVRKIKPLHHEINIKLSYLETLDVKNLLPIKAPHYIALYSQQEAGYLMNSGFMLQQIDLYLSARGIGSCWLGMAKPAKGLAKQKDGLDFVILLAFGNGEEAIGRESITSFKRKDLKDISNAVGVEAILDPVRLAPSATNSQPWFFTGDQDLIHLHRTKLSMIKAPLYDNMNQVDMGIAAYYLYLSGLNHEKKVSFIQDQQGQALAPKGYEYMISAKLVD